MTLDSNLVHKDITDRIWNAALAVHRALGPGLLESTYEFCLFDELTFNGVEVARQVEVPVTYRSRTIDCGYRIDLLVANKVIIEVKSVDKISPIHTAQLLTYMKLAGMQVGMLINFNVKMLIDGVVRRALTRTQENQFSAFSANSAVNALHCEGITP